MTGQGAPLPDSENEPRIRTVTATRYVTPLREGGSLPAIIEADDLGSYVLKFRGAGQGPRVLIAELLAGELARMLGLPMPELVYVMLDAALARSEPDPEIQDLMLSSAGLNLALDYLPGSFAYEPGISQPPDPWLASAIVWFDAYVTNVDRSARNTNLLIWHHSLWLIDNGASLYFQYTPGDVTARARLAFPQIRQHVLLPYASRLVEVDEAFSEILSPAVIGGIVDLAPDSWLEQAPPRAGYATYLIERLRAPHQFLEDARAAHADLV
ncbi:MAG: HipA family kinase [Chloroflexota bacterium]